MTSTQQFDELKRRIWQIANDVRGTVDGWVFKQYVLGALFYRFVSENFDDSYAFRCSMNSLFISHYFQTARFTSEKEKHVSRGKVKRLLISGISKMCIPVPFPNDPEKSLAEQARIVAILDKFDTLTHSISEGLPREIELRQRQYEYYRDLLLSFPKPDDELAA